MHKAGPEVKAIIEKYIQTLRDMGIDVEGVVLYGSFAKGAQREGSDIDLIVVSKDFRDMNLRERLEVLGIAAARILKPIEARGYTPEEIERASPDSFLKEVLEIGVSV